ncbi:hypothetical protein CSUB01_10832 [Colletotrichum sublineola]|uniref:Uncharacterized protein n=1 Tax=Colletotrichum sublineola TaxID=1173701 RepID=A0A066XPG7_COLSU|nr:hypothetical protein CSUB01_10832 [Colletotrichum sublineola]
MKLSLHTIFIAAAYGAAAVQIHFHTTTGCNGAFLSCSNLPPNGCCSSTRQFHSVCISQETLYTSANWGRIDFKRDVEGGNAPFQCIRPQELEFTDGTQFNLTSLSDVDYNRIVNLAPQTPKDLPEEFQQLKMLA